jgi:hypothetical protein
MTFVDSNLVIGAGLDGRKLGKVSITPLRPTTPLYPIRAVFRSERRILATHHR